MKSKYVDWLKNDCDVAPFAGAWIEIALMPTIPRHVPSLPSRERGLKFTRLEHLQEGKEVAPFAGAWIEMYFLLLLIVALSVAPFAGAWIEIYFPHPILSRFQRSLPSRERGLKLHEPLLCPLWGSRSLRGSVD